MFIKLFVITLITSVIRVRATMDSKVGNDQQFAASNRHNQSGHVQRSSKILSLFTIVRFANTDCTAANGNNGTCYTSTECSKLGGTGSGSCASGFGTCCVVTVTTCGSTISTNSTYWQNPGYGSSYTSSGLCTLYVQKASSNISQLRLDFMSFVIAGPSQNTSAPATATKCLTDTFTVSGQSNSVPTICGTNSGQHIYLDSTPGQNTFTLNMITSGSSNSRSWNIRISQIEYGTTWTAPDNCLQWYTSPSATFSSFNYQFATSPSVQHLANQDYTTCIRTNAGYCGISYTACPNSLPALTQFAISSESAISVINEACLTDFVQIPCAVSSASSVASACTSTVCGEAFSAVSGATTPATVYSYRKPFEVRFYTDASDSDSAGSIGYCLSYTQLTCNSG